MDLEDQLSEIADRIESYCEEISSLIRTERVDYVTLGIGVFADEIDTASLAAGRAAQLVKEAKLLSSNASILVKQERNEYQRLMDAIVDKFRVKYSNSSWDDQAAGYRRQFDGEYGYEPTIRLRTAEDKLDRITALMSAILELCNNSVYKSRIDLQAMVNVLMPGVRSEY